MSEIKQITDCSTPLKAIKQYCYECSGESIREVKRCCSETCPLKPFRMGKNTLAKKRELTPEEREKAAQRFAEARNKNKEK